MKKLDLSNVTATTGQLFKKGSAQLIQDAYKESLDAIVLALTKNDATGIFILNGCDRTISGSTHSITKGAVYYNGEIYIVDATSFTVAGGDVAVGVLDQHSIVSSDYDTTLLYPSGLASVHLERKIKIQAGASGSGITSSSASDFSNFKRLDYEPLFTIGQPGAPAFNTGWEGTGGTDSLSIRKSVDGYIYFAGKFVFNNAGGATTSIFTLPVGYRTFSDQYYLVVNVTNSAYGIVFVNSSNGDLTYVGTLPVGRTFDVSMIAYKAY